jgi:hypothetical protein
MSDRGQLVLVAAVAVAVAFVPLLTAYVQLSAHADVQPSVDHADALSDADRYLQRSVRAATDATDGAYTNGSADVVATRIRDRLGADASRLDAVGPERSVGYDVAFNATAAERFAETHCPGGPMREFEPCVADRGIVTQSRANQTSVVAVAVDVGVRSTRGRASATYVYWGVNGTAVA